MIASLSLSEAIACFSGFDVGALALLLMGGGASTFSRLLNGFLAAVLVGAGAA